MEKYHDKANKTVRKMRLTQQETRWRRKRKETEANTYAHRAQVSRYISGLLMWDMFRIESTVKRHAQSARERTSPAQKQLMEEVSRVWGKYSRRVYRSKASPLGTIMLTGQ